MDGGCELDPVQTGVERLRTPEGFRIHPNPARNVVQVGLPELQGPAELFITDITGRIVLHAGITGRSKAMVEISHLPASVYMLHLRTGTLVHSLRFVKD